jgi:hypothetical protein
MPSGSLEQMKSEVTSERPIDSNADRVLYLDIDARRLCPAAIQSMGAIVTYWTRF